MAVSVSVRSFTHSVTYVTDNVLKSLKDIVRLSGLDPAKLAGEWTTLERGIRTWIESGHLERIILEVFDPRTDGLVGRWDVELSYQYSGGDGAFYTDTEAIHHAIKKAGIVPATANYDVILRTTPGKPAVSGFTPVSLRSTTGMVEQRIGTTVDASGLSGGFSYYRRV